MIISINHKCNREKICIEKKILNETCFTLKYSSYSLVLFVALLSNK